MNDINMNDDLTIDTIDLDKANAADTATQVLVHVHHAVTGALDIFEDTDDLERFVKDHIDAVANRYHSNAVAETSWAKQKYTEARDRLVKLLEQGGSGEVYDSQVDRATRWLFSLESRITAGTVVFEELKTIYAEYTGETWVPYSARKAGNTAAASGAAWEAARELSKRGIAVPGYTFDTKTA